MTEEELRIQKENIDLENVMKMPSGRRVIWRILGYTGLFRASFDSSSPYMTTFNEGKRAVGVSIYEDIVRACPARFLQAQNEHNSEVAAQAKKIQEQEALNNGEDNDQ